MATAAGTVIADPCSLSNTFEVSTRHIHLALAVDFQAKKLRGSVVLSLISSVDNLSSVTLDTSGLKIESVEDVKSAKQLKFTLAEANAKFGSALTIELAEPKQKAAEFDLKVNYETSADSSGLQWLPPSQTEGKVHPYLFSQFQAIHARSALPVQDTPSIKSSYSAEIEVPKELVALMSALSTESVDKGDKKVFKFEQKVPIPAYLIAIVVGDLVSSDIGPRSRVWSEKEKIQQAAYEFAQTEDYLKAGEELLTPYDWGRYDLLLLPGSFPYGGMENPCLTFVTPTLLAGDRSLTGVIAHEIAHSWMGNLVTNANWEHFWLNEGFTVFVERKILGRLFGEQTRQFEFYLGTKDLKGEVEHFGCCHEFTKLVPKLEDTDPDDSFSSVPYEKGATFLYYLETLVGIENFERFLKIWVESNRFSTVTTQRLREVFESTFSADFPEAIGSIDWNTWLNGPGMPPLNLPAILDLTLARQADELARKWNNPSADFVPSDKDIEGWSSKQLVTFLENLPETAESGEKKLLSAEALDKMEQLYGFRKSRNSEVRFRWYIICIEHNKSDIFEDVVAFLKEQGRMKFVRPLYRALFKSTSGHDLAVSTFKELHSFYHNIAKKMIAQDLSVQL
eukprot:TRINITY_DN108_c0_g1_i2.p1 TRINITY_DN108_c0_g1~~TRINITY_DN108_c0_g1_i2.p1  ORF type:complete len:622 (-),score=285.30 TRINITY_DN108_c0_g1_i2:118-1983(-)